MWQKLESLSDVVNLKIGSKLTRQPETTDDTFEIISISPQNANYTLLNSGEKIELKMIPEMDLVQHKWFVRSSYKIE